MSDFPSFNPDIETASVGLRWEEYKLQFENYLVAKCVKKLTEIPKEIKLPILLHVIGTRVFQMYRTVAEAGDDYAAAIDKLDKLFVKQVNPEYEKFKFSQAIQAKNENFDTFVSRLRLLAVNCKFANTEAEIKSRVIQGCYSNELRIQALSKESITAEELLQLGRAIELSKTQSKCIVEERVNEVSAIRTQKPISFNNNNRNSNSNRQQAYTQNRIKSFEKEKRSQSDTSVQMKSCTYCGKEHQKGRHCPAYGKKCHKCGKINHFSTVCKYVNNKKDTHGVALIDVREAEVEAKTSRENYAFAIKQGRSDLPTTKISINANEAIKMYIDTCCTMNVIDENTYMQLKPRPILEEIKSEAFGYQNEKPLRFLGEFKAKIKCFSKQIEVKIAVLEGIEKCLLGYEACNDLGIVKIINSVREDRELEYWMMRFPSVFSGKLGKLKDYQVKLDVDDSIKPVCVQSRPLPFHMREKMDLIIKKGIEDDIFEEASGPTTWLLNPMLVPKSEGRTRFVLDASPVNVAIKRTKYAMPTIEELITDINGSTVFSKFDFMDAFHQVELAEESRHLTTFRTHDKIYRYKRLIQGITSVPEIFHHIIQERVVNGLMGTRAVFDDILIHGIDEEDHDKKVEAFLMKCSKLGLTVNPKKCKIKQKSVEFFGLIFSADGIRLTHDKLQALRDATDPTTPGEVSSLLGLATYCSRFIKNLATVTEPLRRLTRKSAKWEWGEEQQKSLKLLKEAASGEILAYYNTSYNTELIVDAGPIGLGAILMQQNPNDTEDYRVISYASRSLNDVERRYSHIEKECLAMVWGCEKFYLYLYGRQFTITTDNKALYYIFGHNRHKKMPARIERWSLRLAVFDFKIKHRPGITNPADYLSRKPLVCDEQSSEESENYINYLFDQAIPKSIDYKDIIRETNDDIKLQELIRRIRGSKFNLNKRKSTEYDHVFHELSVTNQNVIMKQRQIVVPESLRKRVVEIAHEGHQEVTKTKKLLRTKIWFPKLDSFVEKFIDECPACRINHPKTNYEPLKMSMMPNAPFEEVSVDFYGPTPSNTELLVLIDDYSRFVIVKELPNVKVDTVIPVIHEIVSTFGIPRILKSDNGPTFISKEFERMCEFFGIKHRLTTPYWPRANGEVERFMRNINKVMRNAAVVNECWQKELNLFLGAYRATPHSSTGVAPAELIFKFNNTQRLAQVCEDRQFERTKIDEIALENDRNAKLNIKKYGDKHLKVKISNFKVGDIVLYQQPCTKLRNKKRPRRLVENFEILDIKNSMITVKSLFSGKIVTRNSSCFIHSKINVDNLQQVKFPIEVESNLLSEIPVVRGNTEESGNNCERRVFNRSKRGQIERLQVNFSNKTYSNITSNSQR